MCHHEVAFLSLVLQRTYMDASALHWESYILASDDLKPA